MYWADLTSVRRANLNGSNVEILVTPSPVEAFLQGFALDLTNNKMYWSNPISNIIRRANLDGSDVEDLVSTNARSIDLDVANGKMYWIDAGSIRRSNLDGTSIETVTGFGDNKYGRALALDPTEIPEPSSFVLCFTGLLLLTNIALSRRVRWASKRGRS